MLSDARRVAVNVVLRKGYKNLYMLGHSKAGAHQLQMHASMSGFACTGLCSSGCLSAQGCEACRDMRTAAREIANLHKVMLPTASRGLLQLLYGL